MAKARSNTPENIGNLESYSLIWIDSNVNSSTDNRQVQQQLKSIIHHLVTFEDDQQCLRYLKNLSKNDRAIVIASGRSGRNLVPQIAHLRSITSIYIFCMDKRANEQWTQQYAKVKGVVVRLNELMTEIQKDYLQQQDTKLDESLSIKIFDRKSSSSDQFLQSQLFLDCLIRLKSSPNEKNELVSFCMEYYQNNPSQLMIIKEFDKSYSSDRVLWWFTRYAFLSRLLIKALQEENIDLLFRFRFILHDLGCQLGKSRTSSAIRVYRSQWMLKEEIQLLKNAVGKLISINSFLATSPNAEQTRALLHATDSSQDIEKVFLEIEADPQLPNSRPFSNLQSLSYSSKWKQILFMVGSIFRVNEIKRDENQIWNIRLILCSTHDRELKSFVQQMKNELGIGRTNLLQFAQLLHRTGKLEQSEKYYRRSLNHLPNNHPEIPNCYQALAVVAESKKNFPSSLKWHKKSLKLFQHTEGPDHPTLVEIYNNIGNIYAKMNDYQHAIKSYEKALSILQKTSDENQPRVIKCLNNLGAVYDMKKDYSEALQCYEKALEIAKKIKDPDVGVTVRNIANVYELQGQFKQALQYYKKAVKIYRDSSSDNTVYIQDIETSIQRVSSKLK